MPFNHELLAVLEQACAAIPMPDIEDIEDELKPVVSNDNGWVLEFMMKMRDKAQNFPQGVDIDKQLRYFFRMRWGHIQNSPADYLRFSQSPANKRCVMVAEFIARADEPIAAILMPTLIDREYISGGLMELTEREDAEGKRRLDLNNTFLLMQDNTTLFPLKDWAEYQTNPGEPFFNHLYLENEAAVPLSEDEIDYLVNSSPACPLRFTDLMDHYQDLRRSQHTLYGVFSKLIDRLRAAGLAQVHGDAARAQRDRLAAPEADAAVTEFYQVWNAIPESENKIAVLALRAAPFDAAMIATYGTREQYEAYVPSVEEYLAVLRHSVGLLCTERQVTLAQRARFINCVEVIAKGLEEIREANTRAFEQIKTTDHEDEVDEEQQADFNEVKTDYLANLRLCENKIVKLDVDFPNRLLDYPEVHRKFILELQAVPGEFEESFLPTVVDEDDLLCAFNFLNTSQSKRLLDACSTQLKNQVLIRSLVDNSLESVCLAIDCNANINTKFAGHDLLTVALMSGWTTVVTALLKRNIYSMVDAWKDNTQSPLHYAFEMGHLGTAAKIIANLKLHCTDAEFTRCFHHSNPSGLTVIDLGVESEGFEGLQTLVNALGEDVFYYINVQGQSPLHVIIEYNNVEALNYALNNCSRELLRLLNEQEQMALHLIAFNGYQESLDALMEVLGKGDFWDGLMVEKDPMQQTPLHLAVSNGHLGLLQKMLEFTSPEISRKIIVSNNLSAQSCVQLALTNGRLDMALLLLKALAPDQLLSDRAHARAFDFAIHQKKPEMLFAILNSDLAKALPSEDIDTALGLAMDLEEPELAAALIRREASLGVTVRHSTVLHLALRRNWPEVLTALLERPDHLKCIMKMRNEHNRVALEVVHPDVPVELRQSLEALVKREVPSPPSSPNKKKKIDK